METALAWFDPTIAGLVLIAVVALAIVHRQFGPRGRRHGVVPPPPPSLQFATAGIAAAFMIALAIASRSGSEPRESDHRSSGNYGQVSIRDNKLTLFETNRLEETATTDSGGLKGEPYRLQAFATGKSCAGAALTLDPDDRSANVVSTKMIGDKLAALDSSHVRVVVLAGHDVRPFRGCRRPRPATRGDCPCATAPGNGCEKKTKCTAGPSLGRENRELAKRRGDCVCEALKLASAKADLSCTVRLQGPLDFQRTPRGLIEDRQATVFVFVKSVSTAGINP